MFDQRQVHVCSSIGNRASRQKAKQVLTQIPPSDDEFQSWGHFLGFGKWDESGSSSGASSASVGSGAAAAVGKRKKYRGVAHRGKLYSVMFKGFSKGVFQSAEVAAKHYDKCLRAAVAARSYKGRYLPRFNFPRAGELGLEDEVKDDGSSASAGSGAAAAVGKRKKYRGVTRVGKTYRVSFKEERTGGFESAEIAAKYYDKCLRKALHERTYNRSSKGVLFK